MISPRRLEDPRETRVDDPGTDPLTVYRFKRTDGGREISPQHMWGTREAIAGLGGCLLLEETARQVDSCHVEGGFFYDIPESVSIKIDSPSWSD